LTGGAPSASAGASRTGYLAWAVAAAAAVMVVVLAAAVGEGGALRGLDETVFQWIRRHSTPTLDGVMTLVSNGHRPRGIALITLLAAVVLWWRRDRLGALALVGCVAVGSTLNHLLKHSIMRPRPGLSAAESVFTDYSFPSGHVANATLLYGTLALLICLRATSRRWCAAATVAAAILVAAVGLSRLVLGVHHLSDVLAGFALGVACVALCGGLIRRRHW
jgi:undecaprenyl-diphosphatase